MSKSVNDGKCQPTHLMARTRLTMIGLSEFENLLRLSQPLESGVCGFWTAATEVIAVRTIGFHCEF